VLELLMAGLSENKQAATWANKHQAKFTSKRRIQSKIYITDVYLSQGLGFDLNFLASV